MVHSFSFIIHRPVLDVKIPYHKRNNKSLTTKTISERINCYVVTEIIR